MVALIIGFERAFQCRLVHALGLVLLLWKRIPAIREADPNALARATQLAGSLTLDMPGVMADALWADEEARVILPPAQCDGAAPLPIAWNSFKRRSFAT
jgi:hypothetical protein